VRLTPAFGEPAVAYDPLHDQYLLVVTDSLAMSRVVAVRLGPDLRPLGAPIVVSDRPELVAQGQPAVVYRPQARDFVVSWLGERADGGADVFAERIGAAGGRLDPRSVNVTAGAGAGRVLSQSLAASAHGPEAAVAWEDQDGVRARRLGRSLRLGAVRARARRLRDLRDGGGAGGLVPRAERAGRRGRSGDARLPGGVVDGLHAQFGAAVRDRAPDRRRAAAALNGRRAHGCERVKT
jgi:hypothetical protein